jgi:hypothetical protein
MRDVKFVFLVPGSMEGKRISKRVLEWKPTGRRNRGRQRERWIKDIEEDIKIMGI